MQLQTVELQWQFKLPMLNVPIKGAGVILFCPDGFPSPLFEAPVGGDGEGPGGDGEGPGGDGEGGGGGAQLEAGHFQELLQHAAILTAEFGHPGGPFCLATGAGQSVEFVSCSPVDTPPLDPIQPTSRKLCPFGHVSPESAQ